MNGDSTYDEIEEIINGHNLYAKTFPEEFEEIKKFLENNPSEIAIIDLNGDWFQWEWQNYLTLRDEIEKRYFIKSVNPPSPTKSLISLAEKCKHLNFCRSFYRLC